MSNYDKAKAVVAALEEASPQLLALLAESGELPRKIQDRVSRFNLAFVRRMERQPENRELEIEESLLPLLLEFPQSQDQRPLNPAQKQAVENALDQWADSQPPSEVSPSLANLLAETSA